MGVDWSKPLRRVGDKAKVVHQHALPDWCQKDDYVEGRVVKCEGDGDVSWYYESGRWSRFSQTTEYDLENYEPDLTVFVNVWEYQDGTRSAFTYLHRETWDKQSGNTRDRRLLASQEFTIPLE